MSRVELHGVTVDENNLASHLRRAAQGYSPDPYPTQTGDGGAWVHELWPHLEGTALEAQARDILGELLRSRSEEQRAFVAGLLRSVSGCVAPELLQETLADEDARASLGSSTSALAAALSAQLRRAGPEAYALEVRDLVEVPELSSRLLGLYWTLDRDWARGQLHRIFWQPPEQLSLALTFGLAGLGRDDCQALRDAVAQASEQLGAERASTLLERLDAIVASPNWD